MNPPIEWKLSPKVTMRFGFKDGRVEFAVTMSPLLPSIKLVMEEDEIPQAIEALQKAREWNEVEKNGVLVCDGCAATWIAPISECPACKSASFTRRKP